VMRYDPLSIWDIDMGDRYGRSDVNDISIMLSIWNMVYRYGIWFVDMVINHHIDMVFLNIDMGYGLMIWGMTVSICSSPDTVIFHIDMAYLDTLALLPALNRGQRLGARGLMRIHTRRVYGGAGADSTSGLGLVAFEALPLSRYFRL